MGSKKGGHPRRYTAAERDEAVRLAGELGNAGAAARLGIPKGTVGVWAAERKKRPVEAVSSGEEAAPRSSKKAARPSRVYTASERARALEKAAADGVVAAAKALKIARFSIYDWQRKARLEAAGKAAAPATRGPKTADENAARDARILAVWRAHVGLGPSQVRNQLRRGGMKVSMHTVRCVMEEAGYVTPKVRRLEARGVHDKRYEAVRPQQLWHMDFVCRHVHKQKVYVLLIVDDFSRFIVGWAMTDAERSDVVIEAFDAAVGRHGRPEGVMSDGGSAFYSWKGSSRFTRVCEEYSIDQIVAQDPSSNGKAEALMGTVQKEVFNVETFFDLSETRRRLAAWVSFYNFRRTHHALGGVLVPADRFFGRADEVRASIEAGAGAVTSSEPASLAERVLDVFRVTSRGGKLEAYLLGERLWTSAKS